MNRKFMGLVSRQVRWRLGRRFFIILFMLITLDTSAEQRPNIVFIFSDDHATQSIGAYGHEITEFAPTPVLDRLSNEGMRFNRCMVTNSICGPSRAAILTGKYSHLNGFYFNEDTLFDGSQVTFPKLLQKAGYQTAVIGKWHLGSVPTGFDHWEVLPGQGLYYYPEFKTDKGVKVEDGYVTDVITSKAIEWLESEKDKSKPFMLMIQHKAPHREWSPPLDLLDLFQEVEFPEPKTLFDTYEGRTSASKTQDMSIAYTLELKKDLKIEARSPGNEFYNRVYSRLSDAEKRTWDDELDRREKSFYEVESKGSLLTKWKYQQYIKDYLRCLRSLDDNIGRIIEYLEESELQENTVVIYSSDQGFYLGEHGWFDKRFMYDESYRTPLLIKYPGVVEPGSVNNELVSNLDFAQTILDIAGVSADPAMQGKSMLPLLKGQPVKHRDYHYYHYYEYPGWHMVKRHEGIYDGRYKLIHFYDSDEWELIDTVEDPHELNSVFDNPEYVAIVDRLKQALIEKKSEYKVPCGIPEPRNIDDPYKYASDAWKERMGISAKR